MNAVLRLSEGLAALVTWVGRIAAYLALPLMLVIVIDVVGRKVIEVYPGFTETIFYFGSTKLQELEWHLHAALFLLCLGYAYARDRHVRIELVRDRMSPAVRASLEIAGALVFLIPYTWIVLDFGYDFAMRAYRSGEVSSALTGLPYRWIIKAFLPLGFTILAIAALSVVLRNIVFLFGPVQLKARAGYYAVATHHADMPDLDGQPAETDAGRT